MMMTDARGKLGGHVFTKARSGATVRTKVTPANPQSLAQGVVRSRLASLSQAWSGQLAEAERLAWNALALATGKTNIFGDKYFPSGKNLFVALNSNVLLAGGNVITTAPSYVEQPSLLSADAEVLTASTFMQVALEYDGILTNSISVFMASKPSSPGRFNFSGQHSVVITSAANTQPDPEDFYNAYVAKFGEPTVGQKISFQVFTVDIVTGQSSPKTTISTIVTAA